MTQYHLVHVKLVHQSVVWCESIAAGLHRPMRYDMILYMQNARAAPGTYFAVERPPSSASSDVLPLPLGP